MSNFDPYNVLLSIAMTCFVLQGNISTEKQYSRVQFIPHTFEKKALK